MATFVLVPGGWKGSWSYEAVTPLLERAGHAVHALTLTGLRPADDNATVATANLDTHADDVLRLLDRAHLTSVTLVGHSYGGMVITAAVPIRSPRSCKRSGSPAHSPGFPAGSSSTARDGRTGRRSPGSAPGSKPIPDGGSTTSRPATTCCTRPRRRSPLYCLR